MDDNIGAKYGRLIIKEFVKFRKYKRSSAPIYNCSCECGNEKEVSLWDLKRGSTSSCGCLRKELNALSDGEASFNTIYRTYVRGAEKRGYEFKLEKEEFRKLTLQECYYCGAPPANKITNKYETGDYIYNGVDRLNNTIGYTSENSASCCKICNRAKSDLDLEEFKEWIERIKIKNS